MVNKRDDIQKEAITSWINSSLKSTLTLATGVGKSKIGIMAIEFFSETFKKINKKKASILIVVPTEVLRDNNWKEEFTKWKAKELLKIVDLECYASLHKIDKCYDLIVLDEVHRITPLSNSYFKKCNPAILGLTATPPEDLIKIDLIQKLCPVSYQYSINQAVADGVVAPFKIKIVEFNLDSTNKNILAGTKLKPFYNTEQSQYDYLSKNIMRMRFSTAPNADKLQQFAILNRMRFIYNLPTKTLIAKKIIETKLKNDKSLIFCGSIKQADELCKNRFHSKAGIKSFDDFSKDKIKRLSVVNAANEGINFPNVDSALIVQINSKQLTFVQRLGK